MRHTVTKPEFAHDATVIARREVEGHFLMEAVYPPMLHVRKHAHATANFCIALEGRCTERYADKLREYQPLTLDFFPANHSHSLAFDHTPLRCFNVDVSPRLLASLRELSLRLDTSIHCHGGPMAWLFLKLYHEFLQKDAASSLAIEGLVLEMLCNVARSHAEVADRIAPRWLEQARDMLHARFWEELSLREISRTVGVHPVHLAREFRRHFRCTVGEYTRRLRIEYACRQMANPRLSLATIASAAGFADQSHFTRTFKRLVGQPPRTFRANLAAR